jgi:hypothetical protein
VTALIPSIMERTLLFNFPASLRDVRNWQHLGDVAILADVHFAPTAVFRPSNVMELRLRRRMIFFPTYVLLIYMTHII